MSRKKVDINDIEKPDFLDFIQLLIKHEARYLIVGGYAVAFHGSPRFTEDLDIWIEKSEENAERMMAVVKDFGFASLGLTKEDFLQKDYITQLGYPPLRIDILNDLANVPFEEAWNNKTVWKVGKGFEINFVGLKALIDAKKTAGRGKDLMDLKNLKKRNKL